MNPFLHCYILEVPKANSRRLRTDSSQHSNNSADGQWVFYRQVNLLKLLNELGTLSDKNGTNHMALHLGLTKCHVLESIRIVYYIFSNLM